MRADDLRWDLRVSVRACSRLSGVYHVKSSPTNGLRFSTKEPEAIFQDLGVRRRKEVGEFGRCSFMTTLPNLS